MKQRFARFLLIRNSFLMVLVMILTLMVVFAVLLTRLALENNDHNEAERRQAVVTLVQTSFARGTAPMETAVTAIVDNDQYMALWAGKDRDQLYHATKPLFDRLSEANGVKQMQFTGADFKVFLRAHNPALFGDDTVGNRPTLVDCITNKHPVMGLEQGRSGYGFRAVAPAFDKDVFLGCSELGLDLNASFLKELNVNYPGRWAIVNLVKSTSLTQTKPVLATLNEAADSDVLADNYLTPEPIAHELERQHIFYQYERQANEVELYIPIKNFRGEVALYVRYVAPTTYYMTMRKMIRDGVEVSVAGMALTGLAFWLLYRNIRGPVQALVLETERIKHFDLKDREEIPSSLVEITKLIGAVADMKRGLQSFQKYVPSDLVRQLIETKQEARIGGRLKEMTVFFSDIADFTSITEVMTPNELTAQLSEYFDAVAKIILEHRGTVDKYIGDAVMAFWGAPYDLEDHAVQACLAAIRCSREIDRLSARWQAEGKRAFHTRIGLSTGEIVVGNIGSEQRLNYSVIGDTVNLASRLEGLNKVYGTRIIVGETTFEAAEKLFEARLIDFVNVKGKAQAVRIYELIAEKGDISPRQKESLKMFARAMQLYTAAAFDAAGLRFAELVERDPQDAVAALYVERCRVFTAEPPGEGWDGAYRHLSK